MQVHLVDGTYELFRCFHGAPRVQDARGHEVGACRGLLHTLLALLRQPEVSHVAVAFDRAVDLSSPSDGGLGGQHGLALEVARTLGLAVWPMIRRFEADDALASGAARFKDAPGVGRVVICSPDKDLAQCVEGERVVLRDRARKKTLDEAGVRAKFGVPPAAIPDYLALVGDAADGIPGLPGWGPKSAATVLCAHGSLAAIPADPEDWGARPRGASRLAETLRARRLEARLYRELCVLARDVPLPHELADLAWRGPVRPELEALLERLGEAPELLERVPRWRDADSA